MRRTSPRSGKKPTGEVCQRKPIFAYFAQLQPQVNLKTLISLASGREVGILRD